MRHFDPCHVTTDELPALPSGLIRCGLEELKACESKGEYHVKMHDWFTIDDKGGCYVCHQVFCRL